MNLIISLKRKAPLLFLLLFLFKANCLLLAQEITLIDIETLEPVSNAAVFNYKGFSVLTNDKGKATLKGIGEKDTLFFQHPSYHFLVMTLEKIIENKYKVLVKEKTIKLKEFVVAASKWEQNKNEIPSKITVIASKEIAFTNPQTAADILSNTGEVFVQKSQMGGGSPVIRGFEANKVLIVVDGIRMNNAIFRSGHLQNVISLDPSILSEAEVIFGPGSVIYGSDALGGVMDFHTKNPGLSMDSTSNSGGGAYTRYSTANRERTQHFNFNIGGKKLGSLTSITYSNFDDLRIGSNRSSLYSGWGTRPSYVSHENNTDTILLNSSPNILKFTGYHQLNLLQKFRYRPNQNLDLVYSFHYTSSSNIPRYDRLTEYRNGQPRYAEWYYGPQKWMMHSLKTDFKKATLLYDKSRITAGFQLVEESRISRLFKDYNQRQQIENVSVSSINIDFDKSMKANRHQFFYGVEAVRNTVKSTAQGLNIETGEKTSGATRYPDGGSTMDTYAGYLCYKFMLNEKTNLNTGVRYSHILLNSKFEDTLFYNFPFKELNVNTGALNGSLGMVYRPGSNWQLSWNASSGFRAPNVDDISKVFDSSPGSVMVPNNKLRPEYLYSAEIGINKSFGGKFKFGTVVFYSYLKDAIVRRNFLFNGNDSILFDGAMSRVQANVNVGKGQIIGYNINMVAELFKNFSANAALSFTEGKDLSNAVPLGHIPPLFGQAGITYRNKQFNGEFFLRYNDWKRLKDYSPSGEDNLEQATADGSPAWYTLNIRASYQVNQWLQANAGLENILDIHYRPFASGVSAPGRNLFAVLRVNF